MRRHLLPLSCLLALALAAPAAGQDRLPANERPATCPVGGPLQVWLLLQSSATDCDATVSGTVDALCCCVNNSWAACASGGGGGSGTVTSVALAVPAEWSVSGSPVTTAGTITIAEATQTANTVYAGPTSGGAAAPGFRALVDGDVPDAVTIGGYTATKCARFNGSGVLVAASGDCSAGDTDADTQVIFDIGDDGGNDSTALLELSTLNDDYGALTEPSADEAQIDFAKIPPYQQYDPNRPPTSCGTGGICDEFTSGVTMTFTGWQNQESSTATAERDGLTLYHPTDSTGFAAYYFTGPNGATTDWSFHVRVSTALTLGFNQAGIGILATGTEASPTLIYVNEAFKSTVAPKSFTGARSFTSYTSAATGLGNDIWNPDAAAFLNITYTSSTKLLEFKVSLDGYIYNTNHSLTLAAHPTTSFFLYISSASASQPAYGFFHFVRVRTDASRLEAGE